MPELDPYLGDSLDVSIDGVWYQCYEDMTGPDEPDYITIPQTRGRGPVDVPRSYRKESYKFKCQDETGSAKWLALKAIMDAALPVACVVAFEGNVAGNLTASGNAYVGVSGLSAGPGKPSTFSFTLSFGSLPTYSPNLVLATQAVGTIAAGGAGSGLTTLVASGGTTTYAYTLVTQLPLGLTMTSGGVFGGTLNAATVAGTHAFTVRVTDSAATPVVKDFICSLIST